MITYLKIDGVYKAHSNGIDIDLCDTFDEDDEDVCHPSFTITIKEYENDNTWS